MKLTADPETMPSQDALGKALKPELDKAFKPAFVGRTVIIPFYPVRDEALRLTIGFGIGADGEFVYSVDSGQGAVAPAAGAGASH